MYIDIYIYTHTEREREREREREGLCYQCVSPLPLIFLLKPFSSGSLIHSLNHHFETVPNSKKLQTKTEIWLSKDFKIQMA